MDVFPLAGLKQTVVKCTRQVSNQNPSLIDQSWTSNIKKLVDTCNIITECDHDLILTSLLVKGSVRNIEVIKKRNYSNFNKDNYLMDLLGSRWSDIYDIKDPTLIDTAITDLIVSVLDKHAPIISFKTGGNKKGNSYLSKECLALIRERNNLRKKAKASNLQLDWEIWRRAKNKVNNRLRREATSSNKIEQLAAEADLSGKKTLKQSKKSCWLVCFTQSHKIQY